ncbi:MAG: hypothetical protein R2939_21835 [Kofleriaceae bacterium]
MPSDKRFPTSAKSAAAYTAPSRSSPRPGSRRTEKKSWKIYFAAFMKKALADIEINIKILDQSTRPATLAPSISSWTPAASARALISTIVLEREKVGVNRNLVIQVESGGVALATGKFTIVGEAEKYKGEVDFTDEETR